MSSAVVDECRAHLFVASLSGMLVQVVMSLAVLLLGVPETMFETSAFRLAIDAILIAMLFGVRIFSRSAFSSAVAHHHVRFRGTTGQVVFISRACPRRAFVILHVRLNCRRFMPPSHSLCRHSGRNASR